MRKFFNEDYMLTWKEIRPVTAGMFAKGVYWSNRAFYMIFRFELAEKVSPEAIRKAWEKTIAIYPYVTYAEAVSDGKLVLLENELPFVIEETDKAIEPFEKEGNFHSVTFGYLDKVLWVYVDHVPYDGTGFKNVLETFFYYYYCELDGKEYPVPKGVFTEKDGVVPGQDVDAYLLADSVDSNESMMSGGNDQAFVMPENIKDKLFLDPEDCRTYCLTWRFAGGDDKLIEITEEEALTFVRSQL